MCLCARVVRPWLGPLNLGEYLSLSLPPGAFSSLLHPIILMVMYLPPTHPLFWFGFIRFPRSLSAAGWRNSLQRKDAPDSKGALLFMERHFLSRAGSFLSQFAPVSSFQLLSTIRFYFYSFFLAWGTNANREVDRKGDGRPPREVVPGQEGP